jgi:hypothetical protein
MYELNAEGFIYNAKTYTEEFHHLPVGIVSCYNMMIRNNVKLPPNDENEIRNRILIDYLNDDDVRKLTGLTEFAFNREVPENDTKGRTDIKIEIKNRFRRADAYYIIECKRLDGENVLGVSGLNGDYIKDGICRFVTRYYSTYCGINGLLGFVVAKMDITVNAGHINTLATTKINCNMIREIKKEFFIQNFDYHYSSEHKDYTGNVFTLYHLMLDYSSNIDESVKGRCEKKPVNNTPTRTANHAYP